MAELSTAEAGTGRLSCHAVEQMICEIWSGYFGREVSPYDDFYDLGGDSLGMIDIVARARELGLPVRSSTALRDPSPARLAETLTVGTGEGPVALPALAAGTPHRGPVAPEPVRVVTGPGEPLHVVHSDSHVEAERAAVASWGGPRPVTGFVPPAATFEALADGLLAALLGDRPAGPYRLAGFGPGAVLAFELAHRLRLLGAEVALLALIDPPEVAVAAPVDREALLARRLTALARRFGLSGGEDVEEIHARMRRDGWYGHLRPGDLPAVVASTVDVELAARHYRPARHDGPVVLVADRADPAVWRRACTDLESHRLDHGIESPAAVLRDAELALVMRKALDR